MEKEITQDGAVNPTNTENTVETKVEEKSIGEIINEPEVKEKPTVGLDKFLEVKREKKELEKKLEELVRAKEEGATQSEVSEDLEALATEYNIDKSFLQKIAKSIESRAEKSMEERINAKLEPITKREREERVNTIFSKTFSETLESMPEYKGIANPDVIKALATNPANAKKTMSQILEEAYGNAITGRRTIERTIPGGGKEPTDVDFKRAQSDSEYFKQIMDNPNLKKKYNDKAQSEVARYL